MSSHERLRPSALAMASSKKSYPYNQSHYHNHNNHHNHHHHHHPSNLQHVAASSSSSSPYHPHSHGRHSSSSSNFNNNNLHSPSSSSSSSSSHTAAALTAGQRLGCFFLSFLLIVIITITNYYPDIIESYTHMNNGAIVTKIDDIVTIPLKPNVVTIRDVDHYYMFPSNVASTHNNNNNNKKSSNTRSNNNNHRNTKSTSSKTTTGTASSSLNVETSTSKHKSSKYYNNNDDGNNHGSSSSSSSSYKDIKGILIFLHSCKQSGLEFFHLPEDRIIAYNALQQGLAVLAPTSKHRDSGCYTSLDIDWIDHVVNDWMAMYDLDVSAIPRMGMAVSSGASFLFFVHKKLNLSSMAVYNTPQSFLLDDFETKRAVPTVFVTMPLDTVLSKEMERNYDALLDENIPTQLYKVTPHPYTSTLCLSRFPEMIPAHCEAIFDKLHQDYPQLLDNDGFVKEPVQIEEWHAFFSELEENANHKQQQDSEDTSKNNNNNNDDDLPKRESANDDDDENEDVPDDAPLYYLTPRAYSGRSWLWAGLEQEMRTCQAFHAITVEHHSSVLQFLMKHAGIPTEPTTTTSSSSSSSSSPASSSSSSSTTKTKTKGGSM